MAWQGKRPLTVRVKRKHILEGKRGDCDACAVALALNEATGTDECRVANFWSELHLQVWGRWIPAEAAVALFVFGLDSSSRDRKPDPKEYAPFEFELPPMDAIQWQEECYKCQELFAPGDLDADELCETCADKTELKTIRDQLATDHQAVYRGFDIYDTSDGYAVEGELYDDLNAAFAAIDELHGSHKKGG